MLRANNSQIVPHVTTTRDSFHMSRHTLAFHAQTLKLEAVYIAYTVPHESTH